MKNKFELIYGNRYVSNKESRETSDVDDQTVQGAVLDFLQSVEDEYYDSDGNLPEDWFDSIYWECRPLTIENAVFLKEIENWTTEIDGTYINCRSCLCKKYQGHVALFQIGHEKKYFLLDTPVQVLQLVEGEHYTLQWSQEDICANSYAYCKESGRPIWIFSLMKSGENTTPVTNKKDTTDRRIQTQEILASNMSDDLKLYETFQLYKEGLQKDYTQLYYALLGWKNSHLKELHQEQANST